MEAERSIGIYLADETFGNWKHFLPFLDQTLLTSNRVVQQQVSATGKRKTMKKRVCLIWSSNFNPSIPFTRKRFIFFIRGIVGVGLENHTICAFYSFFFFFKLADTCGPTVVLSYTGVRQRLENGRKSKYEIPSLNLIPR